MRTLLLLCLFFILAGCAHTGRQENETFSSVSTSSYRVFGKTYHVLKSSRHYAENGYASWYGRGFHHKRTFSGERYNMYKMTAAHKTLPLSTYVLVTNLNNHRQVIVKINDRGPFARNRLIDLSYAAAKKLGMLGHGTIPVSIKAVSRPA